MSQGFPLPAGDVEGGLRRRRKSPRRRSPAVASALARLLLSPARLVLFPRDSGRHGQGGRGGVELAGPIVRGAGLGTAFVHRRRSTLAAWPRNLREPEEGLVRLDQRTGTCASHDEAPWRQLGGYIPGARRIFRGVRACAQRWARQRHRPDRLRVEPPPWLPQHQPDQLGIRPPCVGDGQPPIVGEHPGRGLGVQVGQVVFQAARPGSQCRLHVSGPPRIERRRPPRPFPCVGAAALVQGRCCLHTNGAPP
mmetsp:Transcript_77122/g.223173  ORF Transcript_77122/g.223173 Transcript_77122/m.223173 type:complete len:251 (+) Transcript_77122:594-1346(+)